MLKLIESLKSDIIDFTQKLIQIPSPIGNEGNLAQFIKSFLIKLGYDEVFTDDIGNVIGIIKGNGKTAIMYNSHLDHEEIKNESEWFYPPYKGKIVNNVIHGIGASDSKGSIAAQVYAGYILKKLGLITGDYIFTGVVQQGCNGSFGIKYLCDITLKDILDTIYLIVLGNATNLDIYLGHKGKVEFELITYGHTCTSSIPSLGVNAIYQTSPIIQDIQTLSLNLPFHPILENSTIAITNISSEPKQNNKIPDKCTLSIDRYFLPTETLREVIGQIQAIIDKNSVSNSSFKSKLKIRLEKIISYTGYQQKVPKLLLPFLINEHDIIVQKIKTELEKVGQKVQFGVWDLPTDGSYTYGVLGINTIGYSPGDKRLINTPFDSVCIDSILKSIQGYISIYKSLNAGGET